MSNYVDKVNDNNKGAEGDEKEPGGEEVTSEYEDEVDNDTKDTNGASEG